MTRRLGELHAAIEARVAAIREAHDDWPCRRGCDGCCRRLAEIPRLTPAEWEDLREGLARLPPGRLAPIRRAVAALAGDPSRPLVCPLLDQATGACQVYAHRPVACRTYGFYLRRGVGRYCRDIESRVAEGHWATVVWGNHEAIERRLGGTADARELTEWFNDPGGPATAPGLPVQGSGETPNHRA